jgi:hypothetical protein
MAFLINYYEARPVATVYVEDGDGHDGVMLHDSVRAELSADGRLLALDLSDTTMFGTPFDQAAAERAVAWAHEQLAVRVVD